MSRIFQKNCSFRSQDFTTRADDSHAPPVSTVCASKMHIKNNLSAVQVACQALVRFFALHRIKPHAPPLVRAPVNSFEFYSFERTPQAGHFTR